MLKRLGHVPTAKAHAEVPRIVVQRAGSEEHARAFHNLGAERLHVRVIREAWEGNRSGDRSHPRKAIRVSREEVIEQWQIVPHNGQIALQQSFTLPEGQRGQRTRWGRCCRWSCNP